LSYIQYEMKYEIIYTEDCALIVSDEEIKPGDFNVPSDCNKSSDISRTSEEDLVIVNDKFNGYKKIIGHRPFTSAAILEGVPLLPKFKQEDDVKKIAEQEFYLDFDSPLFEELGITKKVQKSILIGILQGTFSRGYNKAKKTYEYTKEDLEECCSLIFNALGVGDDITTDEIVQHIQQTKHPKYSKRPKYFKCEMARITKFNGEPDYFEPNSKPNSQGQKELVGTYEGGDR